MKGYTFFGICYRWGKVVGGLAFIQNESKWNYVTLLLEISCQTTLSIKIYHDFYVRNESRHTFRYYQFANITFKLITFHRQQRSAFSFGIFLSFSDIFFCYFDFFIWFLACHREFWSFCILFFIIVHFAELFLYPLKECVVVCTHIQTVASKPIPLIYTVFECTWWVPNIGRMPFYIHSSRLLSISFSKW